MARLSEREPLLLEYGGIEQRNKELSTLGLQEYNIWEAYVNVSVTVKGDVMMT